jgi:hypothetical protein
LPGRSRDPGRAAENEDGRGETTGFPTLMDPRQLKEIMSQGATRPETPRDRRERELLETELADSPVAGRPLRQRLRNFRPDAESAVRALGGPTIWMRRLRAIEDALEQHERQLGASWRALADEARDAVEFADLWREQARRWSFAEVNELIDRHNRYFPAEARLPMDPRTRDFVRINGRHYQRPLLDEQWILARFPPDRDRALPELQALRVDVDDDGEAGPAHRRGGSP